MRKTWTAFQDQSIRRYLFHTEFFFFFNLQVVWYQGTVCKPWPPFFQKVVIKVSPRNTRSQSNTTIIWACHCCSKNIGAYIILLLTRLIYYVSFCLISLFWWIWLWLHTRTFLYPSKQSLGGGYTVGGRSYPESSCSSIHFFCLKTKNFQTQNFWKLQFDFIWKSTQTLSEYAHLHHLDKIYYLSS